MYTYIYTYQDPCMMIECWGGAKSAVFKHNKIYCITIYHTLISETLSVYLSLSIWYVRRTRQSETLVSHVTDTLFVSRKCKLLSYIWRVNYSCHVFWLSRAVKSAIEYYWCLIHIYIYLYICNDLQRTQSTYNYTSYINNTYIQYNR